MIVFRLRDIADERGLSVRDISERAKLPYNTVLSFYRGSISRITFDVLDKICRAVEAQPGDLLRYIED